MRQLGLNHEHSSLLFDYTYTLSMHTVTDTVVENKTFFKQVIKCCKRQLKDAFSCKRHRRGKKCASCIIRNNKVALLQHKHSIAQEINNTKWNV